ncbi:ABC transporter permease [Chelatococcus composti]|jgi:ABC-type spermidine/putrescine transport system permease subunit I|uniref:ABC-type spermidine/putrescine transport system permease subunit I n=1 Tax=Chelatococcus composti TaxID=1743235 RepID=A0A841K2M1_9HYPH|nr:ABC transporter permease [Chelatococcus composti]MBB6166767.1 ABC-type spermidine/putrescine transport system permease subunit I [Chelatococcus composti]MBS7734307.1 ABC transporter permease [Chelatococcus composti]GGG25938.1 ABC transporter permease [Chelatococcus composti]
MPLGPLAKWLLLAPAVALLLVLFLTPVGWFISASLMELGSWQDIWDEVAAVMGTGVIVRSIINTNGISLAVTLLTLVIGYPVAYAMTRARGLTFTLILVCVVLPYFTSTIVRTYAWMVILGRNGIINQLLLGMGLVDEPLQLMYNRLGVLIGMTYVLLPYMVLTLFATMKSVDGRLLQAAAGMGARPMTIFTRVFFPLTFHGVMAGSLIVYILAMGFFITPALMGGPDDLMMAMLIEREVELSHNWPVAAIMTIILLVITLSLYAVYTRFSDSSEERLA